MIVARTKVGEYTITTEKFEGEYLTQLQTSGWWGHGIFSKSKILAFITHIRLCRKAAKFE